MESLIYIGTAVVIGLLIGFVALCVAWLRKSMLRKVRKHTLGLMSVYDDLIDEKSRKLSYLEEELRIKENKINSEIAQSTDNKELIHGDISADTLASVSEMVAGTSYRDSIVGEIYPQIRSNFSFDPEDILPVISETNTKVGGPASRILEKLDFETVYQLSLLSEEDQLTVLYGSLSTEDLAVLDEYIQVHGDFQVFGFYDSLKSRAAEESNGIKLFVSNASSFNRNTRASVEITENSDICEGFQLEKDGKLYDYCIKRKELCE